jgi:putative membrane protein
MMGHGGMGWGGMGVGGMIGMVVFWLVLIALIVWAVSRLLPGRHVPTDRPQPGQETAEEILDRRFARGEVDLETYQVQRAALASARGERPR